MADTEIKFVPAHSTEVERHAALRATMNDGDDEAVKDDAADEAERSISDFAVDTKARARDKQADRSIDAEFNRHSAAMRIINPVRPRPPSADTSGFTLFDRTCRCCAKSFRTMQAKDFCSDKCTKKGPDIAVMKPREMTCERCAESFRSKRKGARFCSQACQKADRRAELSRTTLREAA
jgi:hypothetical protein